MVKCSDDLWAIGDCAYIADGRSTPCPPTAQYAIREMQIAAENILLSMRGKNMKKFGYDGNGQMAVIAERKAIARFAGFKLYGIAAWWLWRVVICRNYQCSKSAFACCLIGPSTFSLTGTSPTSGA